MHTGGKPVYCSLFQACDEGSTVGEGRTVGEAVASR